MCLKKNKAPKKEKKIIKRLLSFLPSFLLRHQISLDCKKRAKKQEPKTQLKWKKS